MSLLLLFNQVGGPANFSRTDADTLAAMSEALTRAIAEKERTDTETLGALSEAPTRSVGWTRHEYRPYE